MKSIVQLHDMEPHMLGELIKSLLKEEIAPLFLLINKQNSDEYLTRKETATFLHISETTLWNLDKTQVLPARRLNGKVLYLKSDLLNFSERSA